jgi:NADH:ubiquinone oxidoreductase subunit 5 (subunit L)/multisubunit Na+/H+ antiporter MnhA subunit
MYLLVALLPLLNSILLGLFGFKIKLQNIKFLAILNMTLTLLISYFIFYEVVLCECACYLKLTD